MLARPHVLVLLVLLFVASGCAALVYEIVWFQLLQLVFGSTAVSLGVLLGTFMGGMCLGSLALPRIVGRSRHPLRVYAWLEVAIGVLGLVVLLMLPHMDRLYVAIATRGWLGIVFRAAIASLCLLPPTFFMGATLPCVARWVEATPRGVSWMGFFYSGNITGAVLGCLLAGFYLLRVYDATVATFVAVGLNFAIAAVVFSLVGRMPDHGWDEVTTPSAAPASLSPPGTRPPATHAAQSRPAGVPGTHDDRVGSRIASAPWTASVYVAIALSGASALGAEVIWTRLLSLLFGATVYTFSIILAVFLVGLGIGSHAGAVLARGPHPRLLLTMAQLLLTGAIAWAAYQMVGSLPYWPINVGYTSDPWIFLQMDLVRGLYVVLPAASLWGASFPLAVASVARPGQDPGRLIGGVYAANTVGAIIGAIVFSTVVVSRFGTQAAQHFLIATAFVSTLVAGIPLVWDARRPVVRPVSGRIGLTICGVATATAIAFAAAWSVPMTRGDLIAYGRYLPRYGGDTNVIFQREGMNSSVAVTLADDSLMSFHVSGKVEASNMVNDMRMQRMLGHLPALFHPEPKSVLVVGCGAGVTAGSFVVHPSVKRIVICEIEPVIPREIAPFFHKENHDVVHDPRVEIVFDDARHFVLTTRERFDVITSDPIHPWVKGAATLYTREYFQMCRQRLNPGGVITQWVPLYESNEDAVKSEFATFFDVFPEGSVWGNDNQGSGYDVVLLGQNDPLTLDVTQFVARLDRPDHLAVVESLQDVGIQSALDVLGRYAGSARELTPWLAGAQINRDRNLRLQYLAALNSAVHREGEIQRHFSAFLTYPDSLFRASESDAAELRKRLGLEKKE